MFNKLPKLTNSLNVEYKGHRVENVLTKLGSLISPEAEEVGRKLDKATEKVTIKIED